MRSAAAILAWTTVSAREIVFPPLDPLQAPLVNEPVSDAADGLYRANFNGEQLLAGSTAVTGLNTFANLPHVHCLSRAAKVEPYDIAFLGAPFDTAVTARPGARYGPAGVRLGSRRIEADGAYDFFTGANPFKDWATIVDCGDAPLTFLDNTVALKQLDAAHRVVSARRAASHRHGSVPRIITLGGDHTTTLSALRSVHTHWGAVSVIHFDSHIDTWDPAVLGGGFSHYAGVNHGTFLHIAAEEGLLHNHTSAHAGIRAPVSRRHGDNRNDVRCGFATVGARQIDRIGVDGIVSALRDRVNGSKVYISVDIDVLDPAFAPATGTAEVGGWSPRELLSILEGLEGLEVVGADVVEVSPVYDNKGETTALNAAEVAKTLMNLMVMKPVSALVDEAQ